MDIETVKRALERYADQSYLDQMKRLGVETGNAIGVRMPKLKLLAKNIGKDHELAQQIWALGHHEGRILAGLIEEPEEVEREQADQWVSELKSWDEVDQMCGYLFQKLPYVEDLIDDWIQEDEELVKRAGFVLIVATCIHHKDKEDDHFRPYFKTIKKHATDGRNFVKKAVTWALRQIGKRNIHLNKDAVKVAKDLTNKKDKTANWVGRNALKELESEEVQERLEKKEEKRLKKIEKKKKREEKKKAKKKAKAKKKKEKEKRKKKAKKKAKS
jgi:3-methyladenine DNA glycosylase AlkD